MPLFVNLFYVNDAQLTEHLERHQLHSQRAPVAGVPEGGGQQRSPLAGLSQGQGLGFSEYSKSSEVMG